MDANERTDPVPGRHGDAKGLPLPLLAGGGIIAAAALALLLPSAGTDTRGPSQPAAAQAGGDAPGGDVLPPADVVKELRVRPAEEATAPEEEGRQPKADDVAVFMRAKLDHAQDVIEGLAMEDFDAIYRAAHDLALASQASAWEVLTTEEYARQSAEFRRSCESLRKAAREENLDAASLAWMDVTMKCVQCHKYVRQTDESGR